MMQKEQKAIGYSSLKERKLVGAHYTPTELADFVAKQTVAAWSEEQAHGTVRILDPAVGDGELLISALKELSERNISKIEVHGFDTDQNACLLATQRIQEQFPKVSLCLRAENFLDFALMYGKNDLFSAMLEPFDLVIANPPYVRTQVMGAKKASSLAQGFGLSGRVDLYYAFIFGIAGVLKPRGVAGIIVSNRFMMTKAGAIVRQNIIDKFDILHVWDLGDTRLFEAAVLPAVLLAKRKDIPKRQAQLTAMEPTAPKFSSIYSTDNGSSATPVSDVYEALYQNGNVELENGQRYLVQHGKLDSGQNAGGVWRISTEMSVEWLERVKANTYCTFGDLGKIRVGVKTTADKVFISSDWHDLPKNEQPELLRPLITHHIAQRFKAIQAIKPKQILYTHEVKRGKRVAVNLAQFPRAASYLNRHRERLEAREYVLKAGRNWFEIWVSHHPNAWAQPKVVFRDIAEKPTFFLDLSGAVVNGDCYWLASKKPQQEDLLWLVLAVGNSSFIEKFYDYRFNNKLYAGRRRFITQYVEKFPLPDPKKALSQQLIELTKEIYDLTPSSRAKDLEKELDQLVWQAYGFQRSRSQRKSARHRFNPVATLSCSGREPWAKAQD